MTNYNRITLAQINDRLVARTGETFWSTPERKDAIIEVIRVWQLLNGQWGRIQSIPVTTSSPHTYNVPKQIISLQRASHDSVPLTMTALPELDFGSPGWQGTTGTPTYWMPAGMNLVDLSPAPTSGNITFIGLEEPIPLEGDNDFINIGDEELNFLLNAAQHYLSLKEGPSEAIATLPLLATMMKGAGEANANFRATETYRRYMGIYREAAERPQEVGSGGVGVRG